MPKISVIVPVYNVEKYLHRCVDCILSQTFTDFELLLINDGSKDWHTGVPVVRDLPTFASGVSPKADHTFS